VVLILYVAALQDAEMDIDEAAERGEVNLANALDLSESEEEEELEDIIDDFATQAVDEVRSIFTCASLHLNDNVKRTTISVKSVYTISSSPPPSPHLFPRTIRWT
jgi:hypothetical protein